MYLFSRRSFDGGRDRFNDANRQRISAPQTTPNRRPNRLVLQYNLYLNHTIHT